MNKVYRTVYNESTQTWIAVPENVTSHSKSNTNKTILSAIMATGLMVVANQAMAAAAVKEGSTAATGTRGTLVVTGSDGSSTADATGQDSTTIGTNSGSYGQSSYAIGTNAKSGDANNAAIRNTLAIGTNTVASGGNAIAIGQAASSTAQSTLALGDGAKAQKGQDTAIGVGANANGNGATAVGYLSQATGYISFAAGNANASGAQAIAIGRSTVAAGNDSISLGTSSSATGVNAISIGKENEVSGTNSGAIGNPSYISGTSTYSLGNNNGTQAATITANDAGVFGNGNALTGNASRIIGNTNNVSGANTFVMGNNVTATAGNNVILGHNSSESSATTTNGAPTQVNNATVGTTSYSGFAGTASGIVSVGAQGAARQITNVAPGAINATSTDAINGSQLYSVLSTVNSGGSAPSNFTITAQGGNGTVVNNGSSVDFNNTDGNIVVSKTPASNDVTVNLARDVKVDSVNAGGTVINNGGLSFADAAGNPVANSPSITPTGINAGNQKITNVAAGTADTDAVNVSQLNSALTNAGMGPSIVQYSAAGNVNQGGGLASNDVTLVGANANAPVSLHNVADGVRPNDAVNVRQLQGLSNRVEDVADEADAGTAAAMAAAGLPQVYLPGKSMVAVAGSTYRGKQGYAVGFSAINDGGNWIVKGIATGNSKGKFGVTIGAGYQW